MSVSIERFPRLTRYLDKCATGEKDAWYGNTEEAALMELAEFVEALGRQILDLSRDVYEIKKSLEMPLNNA